MEYELYYEKPVNDIRLQKATEFNDKHIYWLMTESGRHSKLGNFNRLATYHSGRREDDYDYDVYEFTEGDVLAENSKYIYSVHIADSENTKKNMQPLKHMKYLSYPVYYPIPIPSPSSSSSSSTPHC